MKKQDILGGKLSTGNIFSAKQSGKYKNIKFISVMSRHTKDDGFTPEPRIKGGYDEWVRELSPPDKLVGVWHKSKKTPEDWLRFVDGYLNYLETNPEAKQELVKLALRIEMGENIMLLCQEELLPGKPLLCHRVLLANWLGERYQIRIAEKA